MPDQEKPKPGGNLVVLSGVVARFRQFITNGNEGLQPRVHNQTLTIKLPD